MLLARLHHATCVCSDAQRTIDFYRDLLGFSLVKKTVNFDDPHSYHLYFGDEVGSPGSLLTFFEWPRAGRGRLGRGTFESIGLVRPRGRPEHSRPRIPTASSSGSIRVTGRRCATSSRSETPICTPVSSTTTRHSRSQSPWKRRPWSAQGTTHHIAWRAAGMPSSTPGTRLEELGAAADHSLRDRKYFRSVYFRMPDGILVEIATDGPGFLVDEPRETLGRGLSLPPWLEADRSTLERELSPIS